MGDHKDHRKRPMPDPGTAPGRKRIAVDKGDNAVCETLYSYVSRDSNALVSVRDIYAPTGARLTPAAGVLTLTGTGHLFYLQGAGAISSIVDVVNIEGRVIHLVWDTGATNDITHGGGVDGSLDLAGDANITGFTQGCTLSLIRIRLTGGPLIWTEIGRHYHASPLFDPVITGADPTVSVDATTITATDGNIQDLAAAFNAVKSRLLDINIIQ